MTTPFKPVANIDAVLSDPALTDRNGPRGNFDATLGFIGRALGSRDIGVTITVVAPGKRAWPRHYHFANDELFVILSGSGTLDYGNEMYPLKANDVVSIVAGTAIPFQIINTSQAELRYLAISTLKHPDVFVYPDSDKVGVMAGGPPMREAREGAEKFVRFIHADHRVGYWDGEVDG
jgi:uncharacterized cupin superfamily protein